MERLKLSRDQQQVIVAEIDKALDSGVVELYQQWFPLEGAKDKVVIDEIKEKLTKAAISLDYSLLKLLSDEQKLTLASLIDEAYAVLGLEKGIRPQMDVKLAIHRKDGSVKEVPVLLRIDTPIEVDYYRHGGILPFVLRQLIQQA